MDELNTVLNEVLDQEEHGFTPYECRYDALSLSPFLGEKSGGFNSQSYDSITNSIRGEVRKIVPIQ